MKIDRLKMNIVKIDRLKMNIVKIDRLKMNIVKMNRLNKFLFRNILVIHIIVIWRTIYLTILNKLIFRYTQILPKYDGTIL